MIAPSLCGSAAVAQPEYVDAGGSDTNPLAADTILQFEDLREPFGFDRVFRIGTAGQSLFARQNGAVTAVFPRSVYAFTANGAFPVIPPGTEFYIGDIPARLLNGSPDTYGIGSGIQSGEQSGVGWIAGDTRVPDGRSVNSSGARMDGRPEGRADGRADNRIDSRVDMRSNPNGRVRVQPDLALEPGWSPKRVDLKPFLRAMRWHSRAPLLVQTAHE